MKETESFAKSSSYLMKTIPRKEALVDLYRPAYDVSIFWMHPFILYILLSPEKPVITW